MKKLSILPLLLTSLPLSLLPACQSEKAHGEDEHHEALHKIVVTRPVAKDVVSTQQYVCQIHSRRHIELRALETGYLKQIRVQEGQSVKKGDVMFEIVPVLYKAKLDSERAEAELAEINYNNTKVLTDKDVVSKQELALAKAELAKARAKVAMAQAELDFTTIRAPFDGIVDRQHEQQGSLVEDGDVLSTMSDNQEMWVYFNVPEARYLEYKRDLRDDQDGLEVQLRLANGEVFPYPGKIGAIEADFDNETGNIAFRADFPNPDGLLRHGQTGTILIHRKVPNAIVIPQRATYEILAKKYVFVVDAPDAGSSPGEHVVGGEGHAAVRAHDEHGDHDDADDHDADDDDHRERVDHVKAHGQRQGSRYVRVPGVVHQREITIQDEMEDIYVIEGGLSVDDRIVFEGIRQVRDGDEVEYQFVPPSEILGNLKHHAE